jgi:hypothetical protein
LSTATRQAIYGKLKSDVVGGGVLHGLLGTAATGYSYAIYHDPAPEDASYPFIVMSKSSGIPSESFGAYPGGTWDGQSPRPFESETEVWLIKGVTHDSSADTAEAIAGRVRSLLNDANLPQLVGGGTITYLRRQSDVEYSEVLDGEVYHHCGSLFRLIYQ